MPEYQMKEANETLDRVYGLFEGKPTEVNVHTENSKVGNVPEISIQRVSMGDEIEYVGHMYKKFDGVPIIDAGKIEPTLGYTKVEAIKDLNNLINSYSDTEQKITDITAQYN